MSSGPFFTWATIAPFLFLPGVSDRVEGLSGGVGGLPGLDPKGQAEGVQYPLVPDPVWPLLVLRPCL